MERPVEQRHMTPRRAPRYETSFHAGVREADGAKRPSHIANISRYGFKTLTDRQLPVDTLISLSLPDCDPQIARVVWSDETAAGCAFVQPLSPDMFRELLRVTGLQGTIIE